MKKRHILMTLSLIAAAIGCGNRAEQTDEEELMTTVSYEAVGDSTCYGFACDGCSDTIIVFMPDSIGDPVSYNVLNAFKRRQVFGNPSVGDQLALYLSPDGKEVLQVIDIDVLKGTWVYQVLPEPRIKKVVDSEEADGLSKEEKQKMDSMLQTFMIPREYGITLKRDHTAQTVGGPPHQSALEEESPVVYPTPRRYSEWHLWNGKLIFTSRARRAQGDSARTEKPRVKNDTVELVMMRRDTLVLRFSDHVLNLSRKPDSLMVK